MRYSWPSWVATIGGVLGIVAGVALYLAAAKTTLSTELFFAGPLVIAGSVLAGLGLHSLQASYNEWCDCADCMGGGCGCNHCEDCVDGECCGKCSCEDGGAEAYVHQPTP